MKFFILGGLPGSGKSTTCQRPKAQENCFPVSSDSIRLAINAGIYPRGEDYLRLEPVVWELVRVGLEGLLRLNVSVAIDATNLNRVQRARWVDLARSVGWIGEIILLWHTSDFDSPGRWIQERGHTHEEFLAIRQRLSALMEEPAESEGFRIIRIDSNTPYSAQTPLA